MPLIRFLPLPLALAAAIAASGCSSPEAPPADATVAAPSETPAPTATDAPAPEPAPVAAGIPVHDPAVVHFSGYRSAKFNSNADAVRAAHAGSLVAESPPSAPDACHYLRPEAPGTGLGFMFEGGKFVRFDVDNAAVAAPGGLTTGMTDVDVLSVFPEATQQPNTFTQGRFLVVGSTDDGPGWLVFEVDDQGTITSWRIGLDPQVGYIQGCSSNQ